MKNKKIIVISLFLLVAAFISASYFYKSNETKQIEKKSTSSSTTLVREHSPKFGNNKKNISVVEFLDPECPSCSVFHPMVKAMYKEYYEDIQLVVRYLPNHKNSRFVVKLLEASRLQNKYNEALDIIFKTQNIWAKHNNEKPELLWGYLSKIDGLDIEQVKKDINNPLFDEIMDIDSSDARQLGVTGTPTLFVNGKRLEVLSQQTLLDLVENEIYK
jgi:protein-disulfide isomerase